MTDRFSLNQPHVVIGSVDQAVLVHDVMLAYGNADIRYQNRILYTRVNNSLAKTHDRLALFHDKAEQNLPVPIIQTGPCDSERMPRPLYRLSWAVKI